MSNPRIRLRIAGAVVALLVVPSLSGCAAFNDILGRSGQPGGDMRAQVSALAPAPDTQTVTSPYDIGKIHFRSGRYGLALDNFRKDLRANPQSLEALNAVAATYDMIGRTDLADRYYEEALAIDPNSVQTINNLGYSYLLRGKKTKNLDYLAEAERLFQRAKALGAANRTIDANLAFLARTRAHLQGAAPNLAQASVDGIRVTVKSPDAYAAWIERRTMDAYFLASAPPAPMAEKLRDLNLDPAIAGSASAALPGMRRVRPGWRKVEGPLVTPSERRSRDARSAPVSDYAAAPVPQPKPRREARVPKAYAAVVKPRPKLPVINGKPVEMPVIAAAADAPKKGAAPRSGRNRATAEAKPPQPARERQIAVGSADRSYVVVVAAQAPRAAPLMASADSR